MIDKISGASYFDPLPKNRLLLEKKFAPLDKSLIWNLNNFFWQNTSLWEKTYGQHYEKSLPTGISSSHEPDFVKKSTEHFFNFLVNLKNRKLLPQKIIVLEQGPGTGLYAKQFLDYLKNFSTSEYSFYDNLTFILSDSSSELLAGAQKLLADHQKHLVIHHQKKHHDLPFKYKGQILFARSGNLWDQLPCRL
ncbi:SAM-dependent methyltransferase, partial [Candidatus Gottesmanbacteria bacterium]|nr:SAM-dependent methyltransferase [Candidatus Gottesmanbacteria bacterium]